MELPRFLVPRDGIAVT